MRMYSTYILRAVDAEVGEQVAAVHELEDDELGVGVEADAEQRDDVLVLDGAHEQRLFEELLLLVVARRVAQRLSEVSIGKSVPDKNPDR